jgi:hypothetical protein
MPCFQAFRVFVAQSHSLRTRQCDEGHGFATASAKVMRQPSLKQLAARVIQRQPITLAAERCGTIVAERNDTDLDYWRAPLVLGRLHLCGNCAAFQFGSAPAGLGRCSRFHAETAPFVPLWCAGFEASHTPAAPDYLPDPDGARARAKEHSK